jgi:hypothetical protein
MRKLYFFTILLIVLAGMALFASRRATLPPALSVGFIGYTNSSSGTRLALLRVTNISKVPVCRWDSFLTQIEGSTGMHLDTDARASVILNPGQTEVLTVAAPSKPGRWRGELLYSFDDISFKASQLVLKFRDHGLGVRAYPIRSEWIDQ